MLFCAVRVNIYICILVNLSFLGKDITKNVFTDLPLDKTGEATHLFDITGGKAIKSQVCTNSYKGQRHVGITHLPVIVSEVLCRKKDGSRTPIPCP